MPSSTPEPTQAVPRDDTRHLPQADARPGGGSTAWRGRAQPPEQQGGQPPSAPGYPQPGNPQGYQQPDHQPTHHPTHQPTHQPGHQQGYQAGYPQGYQQPTYPQPGAPQHGYQQPGSLQQGYTQPGYQQTGYPQPAYYAPSAPTNGSALGLTITSALLLFFSSFLVGLPSVIMGGIALSRNATDPQGARRLAKIGWWVLAANAVAAILLVVLMGVAMFGFIRSVDPSMSGTPFPSFSPTTTSLGY